MRTTAYALIAAVLFVLGCGRDPAVTVTDDSSTQRAAAETPEQPAGDPKEDTQAVVWKPSMLEGGYMFEDAERFGEYVRGAQIVAAGVLTEWSGSQGKVRWSSVIRGELNEESVPIIATGGIVRPMVGERVLFLLAPRDGEIKLHSFCGAAGIYGYSDDLASAIKSALKPTG